MAIHPAPARLAEEALGGSRVPTARHQDVAARVHRSPEVVAFPADPDEHRIQVPDIAWLPLSAPQVVRIRGTEFATPQADCLVGDGDAARGEQVFDIAESQGEPIAQPHGEVIDLTREPVTSIPALHRSMVAGTQELGTTVVTLADPWPRPVVRWQSVCARRLSTTWCGGAPRSSRFPLTRRLLSLPRITGWLFGFVHGLPAGTAASSARRFDETRLGNGGAAAVTGSHPSGHCCLLSEPHSS